MNIKQHHSTMMLRYYLPDYITRNSEYYLKTFYITIKSDNDFRYTFIITMKSNNDYYCDDI